MVDELMPPPWPADEALIRAMQIAHHCPTCGTETQGGKFCGNCGTKLVG
jgi:methionyl-tRNA synthetase